jgi:hypothetical protein
LILLGVTLFLYFTISSKNDWAAGASLVLVAIKPQVIYLFLLAILVGDTSTTMENPAWRRFICTGAVISAMLFNPRIIRIIWLWSNGYLSEL